eukprot:1891055-Rhodomonas_salina.2
MTASSISELHMPQRTLPTASRRLRARKPTDALPENRDRLSCKRTDRMHTNTMSRSAPQKGIHRPDLARRAELILAVLHAQDREPDGLVRVLPRLAWLGRLPARDGDRLVEDRELLVRVAQQQVLHVRLVVALVVQPRRLAVAPCERRVSRERARARSMKEHGRAHLGPVCCSDPSRRRRRSEEESFRLPASYAASVPDIAQ